MGQDQVVCPWDTGDIVSEDEDDEWFYSSIKLYQHLYMFSINLSPSCMSQSPDSKSLALADSVRGQLEVYSLPGKLVALTQEEEGLTSNRDFALVSGSVECGQVRSVEHLDQHNIVTTHEDSQEVRVWSWQQGDDLIEKTENLCCCDFQPRGTSVSDTSDSRSSVIVFGDHHVARTFRGDMRLDSRRLSTAGSVTSVLSSEESVTWVSDDQGTVTTLDWRQSSPAQVRRLGQDSVLRSRVVRSDDARVKLVTLDTCGVLSVWETRDSGPVVSADLGAGVDQFSVGGGDVAVSQSCGVLVFDINNLNKKFHHKGHRSTVTHVFSHPVIHNLVISSDSKHNLHAWVYH